MALGNESRSIGIFFDDAEKSVASPVTALLKNALLNFCRISQCPSLKIPKHFEQSSGGTEIKIDMNLSYILCNVRLELRRLICDENQLSENESSEMVEPRAIHPKFGNNTDMFCSQVQIFSLFEASFALNGAPLRKTLRTLRRKVRNVVYF